MRRSVIAAGVLVQICVFWCGGKTEGAPDDSGLSSCMYLVTVNPDQPLCFESDSASELDTCHHVLDNFIDGGLDAQILPHKRPPTGGLGCCAYADDGGAWSVCYYYDAYTPTNVEGFCAETDGSYVNR